MKMEITAYLLSLISGFLYDPSLLLQVLDLLMYLVLGLICIWLCTYVREDAKESARLTHERKRELAKRGKRMSNKENRGKKRKNSYSSGQKDKESNTRVVWVSEIKPQPH